MSAMTVVVFQVSLANSTSEQGASMPDLFHSGVAKPPGMAVRSWWEAATPVTLVLPLPSIPMYVTLPALLFCTFSDIMYMWLPSQLMWDRLFIDGPVAHHTT